MPSEARKFFRHSAEKYINYVTGNTLFQSKMSLNILTVHVTRNEKYN